MKCLRCHTQMKPSKGLTKLFHVNTAVEKKCPRCGIVLWKDDSKDCKVYMCVVDGKLSRVPDGLLLVVPSY